MKYLITVARGSTKKAVVIDVSTNGEAKAYAERLMRVNRWRRAEVYANDSITPNMDDAYSRIFTCTTLDGKIVWEVSM